MSWALLRIWHLEAMDSVIDHPSVAHFTRTSYLSAPEHWRQLSVQQLANRVEQVLNASYRQRAAQLRTPDDPASLVPFAYAFEWVERDAAVANPDAVCEPFLYPCVNANPALAAIALTELDAIVQQSRPGIAARCYEHAFSAFRIDDDDTWHLVRHDDREAMFQSRYS